MSEEGIKQSPGVMYQGEERRKDDFCLKCRSKLGFPCMDWKDGKFMIKCVNCGEEFEGKREMDRARFHEQAKEQA
jgi:hypothetical protein